MAGGSKNKSKGNCGERELSKILSDLLGGHFARVPNSGAMTGGLNAFRKELLSQTQNRIFRGDLIPPDHASKLLIECKSYKDMRFHQLMGVGSCQQIDEWIAQTVVSAEPTDVVFICFKIARKGWYITVPEVGQGYTYGNHCRYTSQYGTFIVTDLLEFFKNNKETVLKLSA